MSRWLNQRDVDRAIDVNREACQRDSAIGVGAQIVGNLGQRLHERMRGDIARRAGGDGGWGMS